MKIKAFAKLNLGLKITGAKGAYHTLDMLCASVNLCDEVEIIPRAPFSLEVESNVADFNKERFKSYLTEKINKYALFGSLLNSKIYIKKNIPSGAGLGGGTAVLSAFAFYAMNSGETASNEELSKISSDLPYMLKGGFKRVKGTGDIIESAGIDKELSFLVVKPLGGVDSGAAFLLYDEMVKVGRAKSENKIEDIIRAINAGGEIPFFNDLEPAAARLNKGISPLKDSLEKAFERKAFMTGSGSALALLTSGDEDTDEILKSVEGYAFAAKVKTENLGVIF